MQRKGLRAIRNWVVTSGLAWLLASGRRTRTLSVVLVFCLLLFSEGFLRLVFHEKLRTQAYPLVYKPDAALGYRYVPNAEGHLCTPSVCRRFKVAPNGFPTPYHPKHKAQGVTRVAIVDASRATGIWQNDGESYPVELEQLLRKSYPKIEVLNFSIDGSARSLESVRVIHSDVLAYSPDLVVLMGMEIPFVDTSRRRSVYRGYVLSYNGEEPSALREVKKEIDYVESHRLLIAAYETSYIVRALTMYLINRSSDWRVRFVKTFIEKRISGPHWPCPLSARHSYDLLREAERALARQGAKMFVAVERKPSFEQVVESGLNALVVPIPVGPEYTLSGDMHHNANGQAAIAQNLARALAPHVREHLAVPTSPGAP